MDKLKSLELEKQIKGKSISGFKIHNLINNGKSAAVFKAEKDNNYFAFKIFDNELIERFGHEIQTKRIKQEIELKNHKIENLVKIYEGGNTDYNGQTYYFIVMELISGQNIKDYIETQNYKTNFAIKVLEKLFLTTEQLLIEKGIAHRDIKPENIMVTDEGNVILMDLGVLKLVGAKSFSDEEEKSFVGTLRYAPPEFLTRLEKDTVEGWRATNLYQIGATLHDIIMKEELFIDKTPYTNLVIAIKEDNPKISNNDYSFEMLQITRDMMTKDWPDRLKLVPKDRIEHVIKSSALIKDSYDEGIEEILKMRVGHQASFDEIEKMRRTKSELLEKRKIFAKELLKLIQDCILDIKNKGVCNDITVSRNFQFANDNPDDKIIQNILFELSGDLKMGFPTSLYIFFRIINKDNFYTTVESFSVFPLYNKKENLNNPIDFLKQLDPTNGKLKNTLNRVGPPRINFNFKTINFFEGVAEIDDSLKDHLKRKIVELIVKSLKSVKKRVEDDIQFQKETIESKKIFNYRITSENNPVVINRL